MASRASIDGSCFFFARVGVVATALLGSLASAGCVAAREPPAQHAEAPPAGAVPMVSDAEFASKVHELLLSPPRSQERSRLLAGVLARQMDRAATRFRLHEPERGLLAVVGGLYLLRTAELAEGTLGPMADAALRDAVKELALRGDEGRARALYDILVRLGPPDSKPEVQAHIDAILAWTKDELKAGPPTVATGSVETAAVARSLLEPTEAAKTDALKATLDWVASAVDLQNQYRERKVRPSRDEIGEAVRALHSGNDVLAEIFLRDADVHGALHALSRSPSRESIRPALQSALDSVGASGAKVTASQWLDVLHALTPTTREREQEEEEVMEDKELLRAATFGIALEAFRLEPAQPEPAALVAAILQDLGLAEASPLVLADAARAHPDPRWVSQCLALVERAMGLELQANDIDAVRRTYAAAGPLLEIASQKELVHDLEPSGARVRAMLGEIELEQGAVETARALLRASAAEERSGHVLLALARIDRHDGDTKGALEDLRLARDATDSIKDPSLRGDILLLASDMSRESGDVGAAKDLLVDALTLLLRARTAAPPEQRARVEQVLAKVLDRFGAKDKAQQALDRAIEATHDKREIAATIREVVARAFVKKDLSAAKDGLRRAIAAELGDDDIVYYALWVHLLETQLKKGKDTRQDGSVARIFASIPDDGHWVGKLAAFGAGKLPASQLAGLAKTKAEKTEAAFYQVMDARAAAATDPNDAGLRAILAGDGVDLMEAVIAREMLRAAQGVAPLPLPTDIKLP
jgi:tetratricopeptide (TPR) repeat protein